MGIRWIFAVLTLAAAPAWAANYATCVLDKMPGTQNDQAASAIRNVCSDKYPEDVPQGSERGMFSHKNGSECLAATAKDTRSARAVQLMSWACNRLYDEPVKLVPFSGKLDGEN